MTRISKKSSKIICIMSFFSMLGLPMFGTLAFAQMSDNSITTIISREEAKAELFGVLMEGETAQTKERWSECIEPDGTTRYRFGDAELVGKLDIQEDGKACFSYKTDDYGHKSCFRISRSGHGYTFWGGVEGVFTTTSVQHNVTTCPSSNFPTS